MCMSTGSHLAVISVRKEDSESILTHPLLLSTGHELVKDDLHKTLDVYNLGLCQFVQRGRFQDN